MSSPAIPTLWVFCPFDGTRMGIIGKDHRTETLKCLEGDVWLGDMKYPFLDLYLAAGDEEVPRDEGEYPTEVDCHSLETAEGTQLSF